MHYGGGGVSSREQRSRARSRRGGVSENRIAGSAAARLFFLTAVAIAVAIAIATRPFKFHEISVSNTSSSFVSSIHSLAFISVSIYTYMSRYVGILKYDLLIARTHQKEVLEYGLNHPTSSEMNVTISLHL